MQTVMWFRRDLRIQDNKALYYALKELGGNQLVLVFQVNPEQFISGSPNHQAFFSSVQHFKEKIDGESHLQILFGDPVTSFRQLKEKLPEWQRVYFNEDTSGFGAQRDQQVVDFFEKNQIAVQSYQDAYLHGAEEIKNQQGESYKVFTPYYNQWREKVKETPVKVEISTKKIIRKQLFPEAEEQFEQLMAEIPDSQLALGETAALQQLKHFIEKSLTNYHQGRDVPSLDQTSHLSRFLRTGELSLRTVWQLLQETNASEGRSVFEKELCWRDFYNMIYTAHPRQKEEPIQMQFQHIRWENDRELFKKWQAGQTGFPLVDAGMRQLKETGWLHNRLRMLVASFLTKDLLIDWRWGEKYFQQMLIDYDPASNIGGWQWAASTGTDAVPYFRIFNPTTQSERFDKKGEFIRQYVPELKQVPNEFIHQPEQMDDNQQKKYGVVLNQDYPKPIVCHKERRKQALARYEASKEFARETADSHE